MFFRFLAEHCRQKRQVIETVRCVCGVHPHRRLYKALYYMKVLCSLELLDMYKHQ